MKDRIEFQMQRALGYLLKSQNFPYIGEAVSQLEHSLQGAYFAQKLAHSEEVLLASLFHDIGHYAYDTEQPQMADLGVINHEWISATVLLECGFSLNTALLAGFHVETKRYLSAKKPQYFKKLSQASRGTLLFQGGPMSPDEMNSFEHLPLFKHCLQVRTNDEKAKEVALLVPDLETYQDLIYNHLRANILKPKTHQAHKSLELLDTQGSPIALEKKLQTDTEFDLVFISSSLAKQLGGPLSFYTEKQHPSVLIRDYRLDQINSATSQILEEFETQLQASVFNRYLLAW
jgi:2-amino-1-hydroxyethylphosphonate dioxygenase (glycine-forming)